jgi:alpha-galactosidase
MLGLLGLGECRTTTNIPNRGQVPDWPMGAVIESNATFERDRVTPATLPPFSPAVTSLQRRIIDQHLLTLQAGRARDVDLALQAILLDPLVMIRTDEARQMLREMLQATKALLPGWRI